MSDEGARRALLAVLEEVVGEGFLDDLPANASIYFDLELESLELITLLELLLERFGIEPDVLNDRGGLDVGKLECLTLDALLLHIQATKAHRSG
ncbi:MAG: hypothetical protein OEZ06_24320 [Myxococcales bacterium]|nr:hypothetical protein [Myxococcales bacterium]